MSNFDRAVEVLREAYREPSMSPVHACDIMVDALQAAGLLTPDVRVIRTLEELRKFDEYTVFMNDWGDLFDVNNVQAGMNQEDFLYYFPCAVVASGAQVRSAREAMEQDNE